MPVPADHPLAQTYFLHDGPRSSYHIHRLGGGDDPYALDALLETVARAENASLVVAAIRALSRRRNSIARDAIESALGLSWTSVKQAALLYFSANPERAGTTCLAQVQSLLRGDASRLVRRDCLRLLAARENESRWSVLAAADDPHWRVRKELAGILLAWGDDVGERQQIDERLSQLANDRRVAGVLRYLRYQWSGRQQRPDPIADEHRPVHQLDEWDWDPAVLAYQLERLEDGRCRELIDFMPELVGHDDDRVARVAATVLSRFGGVSHLVESLRCLEEPRSAAAERVRTWFAKLDLDRREAVSRAILRQWPESSGESLAWAIDQAGVAFPPAEEARCFEMLLERAREVEDVVCSALRRLLKRWKKQPYSDRYQSALGEEPARTQPRSDAHPFARAAALTVERAQQLMAEPTLETSWHVLSRAARLTKTPIWKIAPEQLDPPQPVIKEKRPLRVSETAPQPAGWRPLGKDSVMVSPLGLSGHYGLPVEGFDRGVRAGVNLLFWEPNYDSLTEYVRRLPAARREALHFIAGTFEANAKRIRADVERVLRVLGLEQIRFFFLFWVRSWKRLTPDVYGCLDAMVSSGMIGSYGLSTHSRPLAVEALEQDWNPLMVRHSAAHRGAEEAVFPAAIAHQVGLITFNNTCYGRLLEPVDGAPSPVSAADCYRFSLANRAVSACLTAPATLEQLEENLTAMHAPQLPPERLSAIIAHGRRLYREERLFTELVKNVG